MDTSANISFEKDVCAAAILSHPSILPLDEKLPRFRMNDKYREQWEKLGENDPYWAILSNPDKKGGQWNSDEFFNTGRKEIDNVLDKLSKLNVKLDKGIALDLGQSGVGCRDMRDL